MANVIVDRSSFMIQQLCEVWGYSLEGAKQLVKNWEENRVGRLVAAEREQRIVSRQNRDASHKFIHGVGQCQSRMSAKLDYALRESLGEDAMKDDEYMRKFADQNDMILKPAFERKVMVQM